MLATERLFHEDTYLFETDARVVSLIENTDPTCKGDYIVVLDRTVFYPQGGGQPSDTGHILVHHMQTSGACASDTTCLSNADISSDQHTDSTILKIDVIHCSADPLNPNVIRHHLDLRSSLAKSSHSKEISTSDAVGFLSNDRLVHLIIDRERRILNARLHSAAHLLDYILQKKFEGVLLAEHTKAGYHFPDSPWNEYQIPAQLQSDINRSTLIKLREDLSRECFQFQELDGLEIITKKLTYDQAVQEIGVSQLSEKALLAPYVRLISFKGQLRIGSSACGGTHVRHTKEIGPISIRKMTVKGDILKIAYQVIPYFKQFISTV